MAESAAVLCTFHPARPGVVSTHNAKWLASAKSPISAFGRELGSFQKQAGILVSCVKTSDAAIIGKSNGSPKKNTPQASTFPGGFEELVQGVCDQTQIAELKMKIGGFEMHLKRNIKLEEAPVAIVLPTEPPPIPSKPMTESAPVASPSYSGKEKSSPNPFTNATVQQSRKLAALEASGASGYVLVSCPTVGSFRKAGTVKGKKQPPACKEGNVIKEGQTICYLDQFGTELPVLSDVDGEIIKILCNDGEAVGYGDPLIAVLPSFHDIVI